MNRFKPTGFSLFLALAGVSFLSFNANAEGIDCNTLPSWSQSIDGYKVNLHHIYCGEPGKKGRAKGFHSMPNGDAPSDYVSSTNADGPNKAGIYTLKKIHLKFNGANYIKSFSSMYPKSCSMDQVNNSIVYSLTHSTGNCAAPNWAKCGPNAPSEGGAKYCTSEDGSIFTIATAVLSSDPKKLNTGFPIYTP